MYYLVMLLLAVINLWAYFLFGNCWFNLVVIGWILGMGTATFMDSKL